MKKSCLVFMILLIMFSCNKSDKVCNCTNPFEDLPWLKELKTSFTNCTCQISIFQASYKNQTVFYSFSNDPLCNGSPQEIILYDCSGTNLKTYPTINDDFGTEVTGRKVIFTCKTK
jgi:hypothetical protein